MRGRHGVCKPTVHVQGAVGQRASSRAALAAALLSLHQAPEAPAGHASCWEIVPILLKLYSTKHVAISA